VPPLAASVCEYATFTWPAGNGEVVVITNVGWLMVVKFAVTVSGALIVTVVETLVGLATLPPQFANVYPLLAVAVIATTEPES
jgi:hypothetical protein